MYGHVQCSWMKDGKLVKVGGRFEIVYTLGICSLEVAACEPSDAGKYTCIAENSQGTEECTCKVTVNGMLYRPTQIVLSLFASQEHDFSTFNGRRPYPLELPSPKFRNFSLFILSHFLRHMIIILLRTWQNIVIEVIIN